MAKTTHQTEWEEISRRQRLTAFGDGRKATFESTAIPNTTPLVHVSMGATGAGDNMPDTVHQLPFGFSSTGDEDDNTFTVPVSHSIPTHSTDVRDLKPTLQHLLNFYAINAVRECPY